MERVILPFLGANMTEAVVRAWHKQEGDAVAKGDVLADVETDKIVAEIEAEHNGVLRKVIVPAGSKVPALSTLALIGTTHEALPPPELWQAPRSEDASNVAPPSAPTPVSAPQASARPTGARVAASPAARRLARERNLPIEAIAGTGRRGEITAADVEAYRPATAAVHAGEPAGKPAGEPATGVLDTEFVSLLRRDREPFRWLSSEMKVHLYRQHGARIGDHVRLERGAVIVANSIDIGAASVIGEESRFDCDRVALGRLVAFGKRTRVSCRSIDVGDALWSKDDVVIGGGGSHEPGATLTAGAACFFGEGASLNPGYPIVLGDEVCIAAHAQLYTHSHWQSALQGYPSVFGSITVGNHVFIGVNAFVFPDVTIGVGATVMVNSFVAMHVPAGATVGGVPAQVIKHAATPTLDEQVAIMRRRLPELTQTLRDKGLHVQEAGAGETLIVEVADGVKRRAVVFTPRADAALVAELAARSYARVVLLSFDIEAVQAASIPVATMFDLAGQQVRGVQDGFSDEVREFCRRRGIRFRPFAWRYGVGHFDGERFCQR
ncbi:MAG TPA: biotin/lipoyl-containing protein [Candidatus Acidoferrales bacterium]|nr:biotin/lipoyl-containing protein [Candidatus Acidoferrales bacterium]